MKKIMFLILVFTLMSSCGVIQRVKMRQEIKRRGGSCEYISGVGEVCSFPAQN